MENEKKRTSSSTPVTRSVSISRRNVKKMIENERSTRLLCSPAGRHLGVYSHRQNHRNGHINSSTLSPPQHITKNAFPANGLTKNNNNNDICKINNNDDSSIIGQTRRMSSPTTSVAIAPLSPSLTPKLTGALRRKNKPIQRTPGSRRFAPPVADDDSDDSDTGSNNLSTAESPWRDEDQLDASDQRIVLPNSLASVILQNKRPKLLAKSSNDNDCNFVVASRVNDNNNNNGDSDMDDNDTGSVGNNGNNFRNASSNSSANERCMTASSDKMEFSWSNADADAEPVALEELELFSKIFKQKRIKLGFTQGDVGLAMGKLYGTDFSQTTISRFEALNLSFKNMCKLKPILEKWLADTENAVEKGTFETQILKAQTSLEIANAKRRKKRTSIEGNMRTVLEEVFQSTPRPNVDLLETIAMELNMDREVVRVWFCNRRQKEKRVNPEKDCIIDSVIPNEDCRSVESPSQFLYNAKQNGKDANSAHVSPSKTVAINGNSMSNNNNNDMVLAVSHRKSLSETSRCSSRNSLPDDSANNFTFTDNRHFDEDDNFVDKNLITACDDDDGLAYSAEEHD